MARAHYLVGPIAAAFLAFAPVGETVVWLWLLLAAEVAVVLMLGRDYRRQKTSEAAVVVLARDEGVLRLLRRTVPQLRSRHPEGVIEAQLRWRHKAEAHRRWRLAS